jgi:anti-sigma B factor antagonist
VLPEFRVTSAELAPRAFVVTVSGEADVYNAPELQAELESFVSPGRAEVIVDLLDVPFIDSTVLGVLLRSARLLRSGGGDLTIVSDDPRILRTFEISGLSAYFRFERSLSTAVERILTHAAAR